MKTKINPCRHNELPGYILCLLSFGQNVKAMTCSHVYLEATYTPPPPISLPKPLKVHGLQYLQLSSIVIGHEDVDWITALHQTLLFPVSLISVPICSFHALSKVHGILKCQVFHCQQACLSALVVKTTHQSITNASSA